MPFGKSIIAPPHVQLLMQKLIISSVMMLASNSKDIRSFEMMCHKSVGSDDNLHWRLSCTTAKEERVKRSQAI